MEPLGIGLIGCGTVGEGVAQVLLQQGERLAARAGRPLELRRIVVRDTRKPRQAIGPSVAASLYTDNVAQVLRDPTIRIAVELVGGVETARRIVLDCLAAGKDVVTANKALLATHGQEIFDTARRHGRAVAFEASVGGGIPIISALTQGLAANQITSLQGILNGTCNFILTSMCEEGTSYDQALAEAQGRGYAEADPALDVDGTDAAQKLAILAQIAFGVAVPVSTIGHRGIANLDKLDIRYASELGYTIRLLAEAWLSDKRLALHVSPVLLRHQAPLALVRGPYNAVYVVGDIVGDTLYYGQGAGRMPTASAVIADIVDMAIGRAQRTFQTMRLWSGNAAHIVLLPSTAVRSRHYLRVMVADQPGVLAEIAHILAEYKISIASVIQHEALTDHEADTVPLVIMTHTASGGDFQSALQKIDQLSSVAASSVYYPVAD
jgi:homoserine dehydrogenase